MMFLPCVGSLLQQLTILMAIYLDLPISYLYIPMLLYGFFGTYALFLMSLFTRFVPSIFQPKIDRKVSLLVAIKLTTLFSYSVADLTTENDRTSWIGVMEGMNLAGSCAGYYIGLFQHNTSYIIKNSPIPCIILSYIVSIMIPNNYAN